MCTFIKGGSDLTKCHFPVLRPAGMFSPNINIRPARHVTWKLSVSQRVLGTKCLRQIELYEFKPPPTPLFREVPDPKYYKHTGTALCGVTDSLALLSLHDGPTAATWCPDIPTQGDQQHRGPSKQQLSCIVNGCRPGNCASVKRLFVKT